MQQEELTPLCSPKYEKPMANDQDPASIPKYRHLGYALGAFGTSMVSTFITVYLTTFLLEVAKIEPQYASMILLFGKSLNAFSDPFVGYLVSQSAETRIGKFRPWMIVSLPFYSFFNVLLWLPPATKGSQSVFIFYYFTVYCLLNVSSACFTIPYNSSLLAITSCQKQRDSLVATRIVCQIVGQVLSMTMYAVYQFMGVLNHWNSKVSYTLTSVTSSASLLIFGFTAFLSVKEQYILTQGVPGWKPVCGPFIKILKFKPFLTYLCAIISSYLSYQVAVSVYPLFFKYVYDAEDVFPLSSVIVTVVSGVSIFAWKPLTSHVGKKTCYIVSVLLLVVVFWLHLFVEYHFIVIVVISVLLGVLTSCCLFLGPGSMMPDVIAAYSLKNGYGEESKFYSITYFMEGMSLAICSSLSTLALKAAGYQSTDDGQQPPGVALALRLIIGAFSVICCLISFISLTKYPITEEHRKEMRAAIKLSMDASCKRKSTATADPLILKSESDAGSH